MQLTMNWPGRAGQSRSPAEAAFLRWLLCWVVLPNVIYLPMWFIGSPPRTALIGLAALAGAVLMRVGKLVQAAGFAVLLLYGFAVYITAVFSIDLSSIVASLFLLNEMSPSSSSEYVVLGTALAVVLATAFFLIEGGARVERRHLPRVVVAVLVLMAADWIATADARGSYNLRADAGTPVHSATRLSGLVEGANGRNVLVVVVEALGDPRGAEVRRLLRAPFADSALGQRYDVSFGRTPFFGSTTNGEMRELCDSWRSFDYVLDAPNRHCLPFRMQQAGYRTTAIHSYKGAMFERERWYPQVGFERALFEPDLVAAGARECEGVFPGACDRDVPRQIGALLKDAARGGTAKVAGPPQFVYWLTVNSHLPVAPRGTTETEHCDGFSPDLAGTYPQICRLMKIYDGVARSLVELAVDPDVPPMDVLIVGDHMPPFFDRWNRSQFRPDSVPYILLRDRAGSAKGTRPGDRIP